MLLRFWSEWGPLSGAVVDPMGILENQAMFNVAKVRGERMGAKRRLETGDAVRGKGPWDASTTLPRGNPLFVWRRCLVRFRLEMVREVPNAAKVE